MTATETRIAEAPWLRGGPLSRLLSILDHDGEEARVVGGAVRNALLGERVDEIDIATTATPDEVIRRAKAAGLKTVPTGIDHGTVTVIVDGAPYEVTTLRRDVETFGRHAKVAFGRDWKIDAERRDFTMNALSASRDGVVYDPVGGLADLKQRRVRFIGNPAQRIAEDALRILRFFRFHAAYGEGGLDPDGLRACVAGRAGIDLLSRERIRTELVKLLVARGAMPVLSAMAEHGLLVSLLGGVPMVASARAMAEVEGAAALKPDAVRRLATLAVLTTEDVERLTARLRLSNLERSQLASMVEGARRIDPLDEAAARVLLYRMGPERYRDWVMVRWARELSQQGPEEATAFDQSAWRALAALPQRWPVPQFPIKAAELIERGWRAGPALGAALRRAEEAWIAADFPMDAPQVDALIAGLGRAP